MNCMLTVAVKMKVPALENPLSHQIIQHVKNFYKLYQNPRSTPSSQLIPFIFYRVVNTSISFDQKTD